MTSLDAFLDLAKTDRLKNTLRAKRLAGLEAYWRGTQYEDRPLDVGGYRKNSPGVYGSGCRTPGWDERDPGCVWNLRGEVVSELTDWTLGGDAWCRLTVEDDEAAEDWITTVANLTNLGDVIARARDFGGAMGTAVVSFAFRNGRPIVQDHNPRLCWPLAWRDEHEHVPSLVAKVYLGDDPLAMRPEDQPLIARLWSETDEVLLRRDKAPEGSRDPWVWTLLERVEHGLGFCPVVWHPQQSDGSHDGVPDGAETEGEIDEVNELFAAAGATTKRNADDTVVIREDPALNPGNVRKGGYNVIFARAGAEYLSQKGESADVCMRLAERRAQHVYRQSGVVMVDAETLKGATSGEALKRLFQRTIKSAARLRRDYAKGLIVPLCQKILDAARALESRRLVLALPPRVTPGEGREVMVEPRVPGKSRFVQCVWPDLFAPTPTDLQAMITAASTAIGGKQVLSRRTAVAWLAGTPLPISNVDEELAAIEEDEKVNAERAAAIMGLQEPPEGKAGAVEDEDEDEEDAPASEKPEKEEAAA